MANEMFTWMTEHHRIVGAVLMLICAAAAYGCRHSFVKFSQNPLEGWWPSVGLFFIGFIGIIFGLASFAGLGLLIGSWYFFLLLVFPEVPIALFFLIKSIVPALRMKAGDTELPT